MIPFKYFCMKMHSLCWVLIDFIKDAKPKMFKPEGTSKFAKIDVGLSKAAAKCSKTCAKAKMNKTLAKISKTDAWTHCS